LINSKTEGYGTNHKGDGRKYSTYCGRWGGKEDGLFLLMKESERTYMGKRRGQKYMGGGMKAICD